MVYPTPMSFIVCGINHKTAPLAVREQVVFAPENTSVALQQLLEQGAANEAMILSTCNRTEIYSHSANPQLLANWLAQHPQIKPVVDSKHWYWHSDQQAVGHMMRVASGLDSMLLGEPQILGQMKQAYTLAQQTGALGVNLDRLLQHVFSVSKQVRTNTGIGSSPVSVAYAGVSLAKRIFSDLTKCQVLLLGSGETIELTALHLSDCGVKRIIIANRSLEKARKLATQFNGHAISLNDLPIYMPKADIVISATGSPLPLIGKGMVESALKMGKRRPMLMIDMAVPRDIEPEVADLEDIYLYNIDSLQEIITENLKSRQEAALLAEQMIDTQARYFMRQLQSLKAVDTIRAYREKLEKLRDMELSKALSALRQGTDAAIVLKDMARILTNKIMHLPSAQLRQAAFDGETEMLLLAKKLFDL